MRQHSGVKPFKCEFCGRNFRQWGDLKYHCISIHSDQKNFQCEYCGKDFARKYSLTVHSRIHTGERNYKCEFCEKSFRASSYLQNHRRIHTGKVQFILISLIDSIYIQNFLKYLFIIYLFWAQVKNLILAMFAGNHLESGQIWKGIW